MQMKTYSVLFFAVLLLACKPAAQATVQSDSASTTSEFASEKIGEIALGTSSENGLTEEDRRWRKGMPESITQSLYTCIKENNYVTIEITNCASDEKGIQDSRLSKIYKELLDNLDGEQKKLLVEAQRSWLLWENKEELFERAAYGSEQMDNAMLELREVQRLARRADELKHYKANEIVSTDSSNASCAEARTLFNCTTTNRKEIKLCDQGETLEYSFGDIGKTPELALSVSREDATTSQWRGIGRWINYSISIPSDDTKYTIFTSVDRISDEHEFEAGVIATVGDAEVARVLCRDPITHNIEGVNLKQED